MALASATREVLGVGDLIERMLHARLDAFERNESRQAQGNRRRWKSGSISLQQEVKVYLSKLGREGLSEEDGRRSIVIIDYAINLEHIGDIIEKGLLPQVAKKISLGLKFSEDGYAGTEDALRPDASTICASPRRSSSPATSISPAS